MDKIEKNIDDIHLLDVTENVSIVGIIDNVDNVDNVDIDIDYVDDNDVYMLKNGNCIENIDCDIINDEIEELKVKENKHLFLTNILNTQIININRNKYKYWLNENYDDLKNIYIKLYYSYFNTNSININFNKFTEFCYLYY